MEMIFCSRMVSGWFDTLDRSVDRAAAQGALRLGAAAMQDYNDDFFQTAKIQIHQRLTPGIRMNNPPGQ
jgi:hypothetical protein